jgi:hypothetical protein
MIIPAKTKASKNRADEFMALAFVTFFIVIGS